MMLDFNGIHWPHVTVGTLVKQYAGDTHCLTRTGRWRIEIRGYA